MVDRLRIAKFVQDVEVIRNRNRNQCPQASVQCCWKRSHASALPASQFAWTAAQSPSPQHALSGGGGGGGGGGSSCGTQASVQCCWKRSQASWLPASQFAWAVEHSPS